MAAKFFGVFGIKIKQGVFNVCNFLFDFFGSFEKLAVTADFVTQFIRKFIPIGAVGFVEFAFDVGKIDDVAVAVMFVGAVDAGQGLQKIVGFDEPAQIEFFQARRVKAGQKHVVHKQDVGFACFEVFNPLVAFVLSADIVQYQRGG